MKIDSKKVLSLLLFTCLCSFLVGCSKDSVPVEYDSVCAAENDKKYIQTSGFLDDKGGVFCSNTGGGSVRCGFSLRDTPGSEKRISADIVQGSGSNNVEKLERGYKKEDIKIYDNDGNVINLAEKVKLTGAMMITPDGGVCLIKVDKIEK